MYLELNFDEVHRVLALVRDKPLTTGYGLERYIRTEQAFLLVDVWAKSAGRTLPALLDQKDESCMPDVVATLHDLVQLERVMKSALADVPPDAVIDMPQLRVWSKAFRASALANAGERPRGMVERATAYVDSVLYGTHATAPWLDGIEGDQGWIRFEARGVPSE